MRLDRIAMVVLGVLQLAAHVQASRADDAAGTATAASAVSAAELIAKPGIRIIAHRGNSKVAPENTLPSFASAVKAGADLVELDYYHSADGVPVVFHDDLLDRCTDAMQLWGGAKIKLASKSLGQLEQLDAGKWFDPKFAGTRIPTLEQALDTIQRGSTTLIERKEGDPATCIELLKRKGLFDRVVVQAFDWQFLTACHKLQPKLALAALGHKEFTPAKLDQVAATGARVVAWEDKHTDASTIAAIHAHGYKAWVWTVDDPHRIAQLVRDRIDGIITNRPAEARQAVQAALSSH